MRDTLLTMMLFLSAAALTGGRVADAVTVPGIDVPAIVQQVALPMQPRRDRTADRGQDTDRPKVSRGRKRWCGPKHQCQQILTALAGLGLFLGGVGRWLSRRR